MATNAQHVGPPFGARCFVSVGFLMCYVSVPFVFVMFVVVSWVEKSQPMLVKAKSIIAPKNAVMTTRARRE